MDYNFNENYILRYEFFGGLLHSIVDAAEFELDFENTTYLKCIQKGYSSNDSIDFTSKYFNKSFNPCLDEFVKENILIPTNKKNKKLDYYRVKKDVFKSINKVLNRNFLSFPLQASLYLNSSCQLDCKFCFFKEKRKIYSKSRNYKSWINLIKKMKDYGIIYISILGGEPTLYENIDEVLEFLEKNHIKTTITTNAINIKDSTMNIICNSNYITPTVSLESLNKDLNKFLMGIAPNRALKTINTFLSKSKVPRINTVYTNQSDEEIFELIDFCIRNGIKDFYLDLYVDTNNSELKKHSILEMRKVREKIFKYIYSKNYQNKINFQVQGCLLYSAYEDDKSIFVETDFEKIKYGCEAGNTKIEVMPDGSVLPCVLFKNDEFNYRNAFNEDIKEIWDSADYLNELRSNKCEDKKCLKCRFYDFCNGGCPALKLRNNISIIKNGDERCQILIGEKEYEKIYRS